MEDTRRPVFVTGTMKALTDRAVQVAQEGKAEPAWFPLSQIGQLDIINQGPITMEVPLWLAKKSGFKYEEKSANE